MSKTVRIPVEKCIPDAKHPRTFFDEQDELALIENLKKFGQQVPGVAFQENNMAVVMEGVCRLRALPRAGIPDFWTVLLPERPSHARLRLLQASLDFHRKQHTPMERSNILADIQRETGWGPSELAIELSRKQSLVSKLLAFQKLVPQAQELLHTGSLEIEKAYLISQADPIKQLELLKEAHLSREEIRSKVKDKGQQKPKSKRTVFMLGTFSATLQGAEMTLEDAIQRLTEVIKELRKGLGQNLDITTVQRMLKDKARVQG